MICQIFPRHSWTDVLGSWDTAAHLDEVVAEGKPLVLVDVYHSEDGGDTANTNQ